MHYVGRAMATACVAAVVLAITVVPAVARTALGVEPGGSIRGVSEGQVTFEESGLGLIRVRCPMTLNGLMTTTGTNKELSRVLPEGLVASITEGRTSGCTDQSGAEAQVIPQAETLRRYGIRYDSFLGTLPSISGILGTALEVAVRIIASGLTCDYTGEQGMLIAFPATETGNTIRLLETSRLRLVRGTGCPTEGKLKGTLKLTPNQRLALREVVWGPGSLSANPDPFTMRREQSSKNMTLTSNEGLPVEVGNIIEIGETGTISISKESACSQLLFAGDRCVVTITPTSRPARGSMTIEWRSARRTSERRVRYEIE